MVTGAAGFIGSHTATALLDGGWMVTGIDMMTGNYERNRKEDNIRALMAHPRFEFIERDVASEEFAESVQGVDAVLHLAGEPGVRPSWGETFSTYVNRNIAATQHVLETCLAARVSRVVYASSSSVYGAAETYPTSEELIPRPISPYGVTKLAGEHLVSLYGLVHGLSTVSLRYFTVFGPRQRPDMAIQRMIECGLTGSAFHVNGDGSARRDFTFVGDVVRANLLALEADVRPGLVVNIGGGEQGIELSDVIRAVGELLGRPVPTTSAPRSLGDPLRTSASIELAARHLSWEPRVSFFRGLEDQVAFTQAKSRAE